MQGISGITGEQNPASSSSLSLGVMPVPNADHSYTSSLSGSLQNFPDPPVNASSLANNLPVSEIGIDEFQHMF